MGLRKPPVRKDLTGKPDTHGMSTTLLPLSAGLKPVERRVLSAATALLMACIAITAARAAFHVGNHTLGLVIRDWLTSAVYILVGLGPFHGRAQLL